MNSGTGQGKATAGLGATWSELESDLWLVVTFAILGGSWERLCWEPRPDATCARLDTL